MRKRKGLRRSLLLDSSNKRGTSRKKRVRNSFLNFLFKLSFFKNLKKLFKGSVILGIIFSLMTLFLIFAIFSPYYSLKSVSVIRDSASIPGEVVENLLQPYMGKNMLFLQKEEITNLLQRKFPELNKVEISEKWPSELEISIESSLPRYNIFDEETANFASITNKGIIVSQTSTEGLSVIKILQNKKQLNTHSRFVSEEWLQKIDLAEDILKNEIKIPIKEIKLLMTARELHLVTNQAGVLWLDLSLPIESQLRKLILAEGKIKLYTKKFDHIDLRIPKQIFWKWQ